MVKIVTSLKHRANKSVILDGKAVSFDNDCIAEVDEKSAGNLLKIDDSLSLVKEGKVAKVKEPENPEVKDEDEEKVKEGKDEKEEILKNLSKLNLNDLKEMVKGLPEEETKDCTTKKQFIACIEKNWDKVVG